MTYTDLCAHMNRVVISAEPHKNCYSCGTDEYTRKDGLPFTEEDIRLLNYRGWVYKVSQNKRSKGEVGDTVLRVDWSLDTSG